MHIPTRFRRATVKKGRVSTAASTYRTRRLNRERVLAAVETRPFTVGMCMLLKITSRHPSKFGKFRLPKVSSRRNRAQRTGVGRGGTWAQGRSAGGPDAGAAGAVRERPHAADGAHVSRGAADGRSAGSEPLAYPYPYPYPYPYQVCGTHCGARLDQTLALTLTLTGSEPHCRAATGRACVARHGRRARRCALNTAVAAEAGAGRSCGGGASAAGPPR